MSTQEFIIKLIKLLKPEFYNKITWTVVIAGLTLMATPFWEKIIFAVLQKEYNLDLAPGGNTAWGFALVVVGLLYHLTSNSFLQFIGYKDRAAKEKDRKGHDINIFESSQNILPEKSLTNFFEWLLTDHSYRSNDSSKLHEYADFHLSPESQYIDQEIQESVNQVSKAINELLAWMSVNFWVFPEKQTAGNMRLCMHPHWNVDRGGYGEPNDFKKYDEATEKLTALSDAAKNSHKNYRKLVKHKLFI